MDSRKRFGDRAEQYQRYRPTYPGEIIGILEQEIGFSPDKVVADVGSGTGISAEIFLRYGNRVYGVEPNEPMRRKAEAVLADYGRFHSIAGQAEATGLPEASIDLIVSAQAFHWFDRARARAEFHRIASPGGFILLIWNDRRLESGFEQAYEEFLLRYGTDYSMVKRIHVPEEEVRAWFDPVPVKSYLLQSEQVLDEAALRGRVLSSSYMPTETHSGYPAMAAALERLFDEHNAAGTVRLTYNVRLYLGKAHLTA
ncbi:MAG TPA: class I SAM-dependent methyltransferase [Bacteroidota bacterium]